MTFSPSSLIHALSIRVLLLAVSAVVALLVLGPDAHAQDLQVAQPQGQQDLTVQPAPAQPDLQVEPAQPQPDLTVQSAPSDPAPAPADSQPAPTDQPAAPAQDVQPAAPAQDVQPAAPASPPADSQPAAPAQDVQPAAPAQDVQPAAPAQDVQPAASAEDVQPAASADEVQPAAPAQDVQPARGTPAAPQPSAADAPDAQAVTPPAPQPDQQLEVASVPPAPDVQVAPATPAPNVVVAPAQPQLQIHVGGASTGRDIGEHLHVEAPHQLPTITVSRPAPAPSLTVAAPPQLPTLHVDTTPSTGTQLPVDADDLQPAVSPQKVGQIGQDSGSGIAALLQPAGSSNDDMGIMLQPAALGLDIPRFGSMPAAPGAVTPEPAKPGIAQQVWNFVFGSDMTPQDLIDALPPEVGGVERGGVGGVRLAGDGLSDLARFLRGSDETAEGAVDIERGWKIGQLPNVYAPTRLGTDPAWSTVRARYWQLAADAPDAAAIYGSDNLIRMRLGRAPQRFNPLAPGGMESMELSHEPIPASDGGLEFTERWPCEHAQVDPFRHPGYPC